MDRSESLRLFLDQCGWGAARREAIPGDASFRRYERLHSPSGQSAILMDAPPPKEDVRPFIRIDLALRERGLNAPKIYAQDNALGFLLLEDFGADSFTRVLAKDPPQEIILYRAAIEALAALHETSVPDGLPPWRGDVMLKAIDATLFDWYWPETKDSAPVEDARAALHSALGPLLPLAEIGGPAFVLRDYHADNLFWLPAREGLARVGLIDFQDAGLGPCVYDLVSLLHDVRRHVHSDTAAALKEEYRRLRGFGQEEFNAATAIASCQRNIRITALWVRLLRRDRKPHYLRYLSRNWDLLEQDLAHPILAPIKNWFDLHFPQNLRQPLEGRLAAGLAAAAL